MTKLSINEMTTFRWTLEQEVQQSAHHGVAALGVWRQKLSDAGEDRAIQLLTDSGLQVSNVCWAGGFTGSDGRSLRESIDDALDAIRLTKRLQAGCLVVFSGARGGHTHAHARRLFREALETILPTAEAHDVTLAVPVVHAELAAECSFLTDLAETDAFLAQLPSDYLKLAVDTYHLPPTAATLDRLTTVAPRVAIVHLGDGQPPIAGEERRCNLGEGVAPLRDMIGALARGGYDGYYDLKLFGMDTPADEYLDLVVRSRQAFEELAQAAVI